MANVPTAFEIIIRHFIVNELDIRESHNGWGTTQVVFGILQLLEEEGIARCHPSEPEKWIRA